MKRIKWITAVLMLLLVILPYSAVNADNDDYEIEVGATENPETQCYEISVEVYNKGKNISGSVMISVGKSYYHNNEYVTPAALPEKSTKTVTFEVPIAGVTDPEFDVTVNILNEKGKSVFSKMVPRPLSGGNSYFQIGVLSDTPDNLNWLDLGGNSVSLNTGLYAVKLNELSASNIISELPNQKALIIDNYDTSALSDDVIKEIEKFVDKGGILYICTGLNEKTLLGFDQDFTGVVAGGHDVITFYGSTGVDFSSTKISLSPNSNAVPFITYFGEGGLLNYHGGGVVISLEFSLGDLGFGQFEQYIQESFVARLINDAFSNTNFIIGNKEIEFSTSSLDFSFQYMEKPASSISGIIVPLILIYIVLVGPVLYLFLKKIGKREKCWIVIPAVSLIFTLLLFLMSFAFSIKKKSVKTVSVVEAGSDSVQTAVTGYSPNSKEWNLLMNDNYFTGYSLERYSDLQDRIMYSADGVAANCRPSSVFEQKYFVMYGKYDRIGYFNEDKAVADAGGYLTGNIKNDTGMDFDYVMVSYGNCVTLLGQLKNGDTSDLVKNKITGSVTSASSGYTVVRNEMQSSYRNGDYEKAAELAALCLAQDALLYNTGSASNMAKPAIIGVKKSDKVLSVENGEETDFTCVYMK